jgi:hypothetical protein
MVVSVSAFAAGPFEFLAAMVALDRLGDAPVNVR